jgi:hypothetical protein
MSILVRQEIGSFTAVLDELGCYYHLSLLVQLFQRPHDGHGNNSNQHLKITAHTTFAVLELIFKITTYST